MAAASFVPVPTAPPPTEVLVRRALEGDIEAMGQLVQRYERRVYTTLYALRPNDPNLCERVQHVLLSMCRDLPRCPPQVPLFLWLNQRLVDSWRHWCFAPDVEATSAVPSNNALTEFHLQRLSSRLRLVWVLREVQSLNYLDLGRILGVPPATIRRRLTQARWALLNPLPCEAMPLERLSAYYDGELPRAIDAATLDHLKGCPVCQQAIRAIKQHAQQFARATENLDVRLNRFGRVVPSFWPRILGHLSFARTPPIWRRSGAPAWLTALVGVALFFGALGVVQWWSELVSNTRLTDAAHRTRRQEADSFQTQTPITLGSDGLSALQALERRFATYHRAAVHPSVPSKTTQPSPRLPRHPHSRREPPVPPDAGGCERQTCAVASLHGS